MTRRLVTAACISAVVASAAACAGDVVTGDFRVVGSADG